MGKDELSEQNKHHFSAQSQKIFSVFSFHPIKIYAEIWKNIALKWEKGVLVD
jgi:hypothetical protein